MRIKKIWNPFFSTVQLYAHLRGPHDFNYMGGYKYKCYGDDEHKSVFLFLDNFNMWLLVLY